MPPWLVLALAFCLAVAALYQLATRRYGWRVLAYWTLILAGFLGAEALAEAMHWNFTRLGDLRLLPDVLGALVVTAILWFVGA